MDYKQINYCNFYRYALCALKKKVQKKIIIDTFKNFLYLTEFNSINLNLIIDIVAVVTSKTIMYDDPYLKTGNLINHTKTQIRENKSNNFILLLNFDF